MQCNSTQSPPTVTTLSVLSCHHLSWLNRRYDLRQGKHHPSVNLSNNGRTMVFALTTSAERATTPYRIGIDHHVLTLKSAHLMQPGRMMLHIRYTRGMRFVAKCFDVKLQSLPLAVGSSNQFHYRLSSTVFPRNHCAAPPLTHDRSGARPLNSL